jgi:alkylated DNA nucleotide flippase Atl1
MLQKVYQLCSQIPKGQVSTYKLVAVASYSNTSAARAVGTILRKCECKEEDIRNYQCKNFCYRIIKSDFNVGKFIWKTNDGTIKSRVDLKRKKLASEGVFFDKKGYLLKDLREKVIFKDFS